jgi:hypothetical protein
MESLKELTGGCKYTAVLAGIGGLIVANSMLKVSLLNGIQELLQFPVGKKASSNFKFLNLHTELNLTKFNH